jgi:hypothetical protein
VVMPVTNSGGVHNVDRRPRCDRMEMAGLPTTVECKLNLTGLCQRQLETLPVSHMRARGTDKWAPFEPTRMFSLPDLLHTPAARFQRSGEASLGIQWLSAILCQWCVSKMEKAHKSRKKLPRHRFA